MTTLTTLAELAQQEGEIRTAGLRDWLVNNAIPILLLVVAVLLLWLGGGKGDNAGVMRRLGGVVVALAVIGLALTGSGVKVGEWISGLFTG